MSGNIRTLSIILLLTGLFTTAVISYSCSSTSNIPKTTTSTKNPDWKDLYYFHADDSVWIVRPQTSAGDIFMGQIFDSENVEKIRNVHIYASPLSSVTINEHILTTPMENIYKVENHKISPGMILGSIGVLGLFFLVPVIF